MKRKNGVDLAKSSQIEKLPVPKFEAQSGAPQSLLSNILGNRAIPRENSLNFRR